ncbi:MAG: hypothetical protein KAG98_00080 [Lentisphaeria bacterium]|nr:hypothetical protein [Lentisphaeria bacterium]
MKNKEQGFILLITLVWLMTLSALVVGILSSTRSSLKNERRWVGMDECYMYGQMALSSARVGVITDSQKYFDDNSGKSTAFSDWYTKRLPKLKTEIVAVTALPSTDPLGKAWPARWQDATYTAKITQTVYSDRRIDFLLEVIATMDGGQRAFEQHFVIKMGAAIFDYAYFINNNGWLHSNSNNTFYVNGNIGANANFSLDGATVLNGTVFAAKRNADEIRDPNGEVVNGVVTDKDGNASLDGYISLNKSNYETWLSAHPEAIARAVLDPTNGTNKPSDDLTPEQIENSVLYNPDLIGNNRMPATEGGKALKMPFLGELEGYAAEAKLSADAGWSRLDYIDENGNPQSITNGVIDGNLIINGPFQIMGKIVVKGDLIIRGTYDGITDGNLATHDTFKGNLDATTAERLVAANGKGGFFVDRNINIIGDLKSNTGENGVEDPFLSLAARGNIIMGNTKDIDQEWISPGVDFDNGQMVTYQTNDEKYINTTSQGNTAFDGNYAGIDASADSEDAISLGEDNIYLRYNRGTYHPGPPTGKVWHQPYKVYWKTKYYTDNNEIIYEREDWQKAGSPYYKSASEDIVIPPEVREVANTYVYLRDDFKEWPETEGGYYDYDEDNNHLVVKSTDSNLLKTLQAKAAFAKSNGLQRLVIKVGDKSYEIDTVSDRTTRTIFEDDVRKSVSGFDIRIHSQIPSSEIPKGKSGTVDRRYYETALSAEAYSKLGAVSPKRIDAVLYTNHLVGGSMERDGSINGALVARDEALKIKAGTDNSIFSFNWDTRLGNDEFSTNSYLQESMEALMPATLGGKSNAGDDGVVFTREVNINN